MQGIGMMAIDKLIILSIFIVILLVSLYFIFGTRGTGDSLSDQIKLRQCCTAYRSNECNYQDVYCDDEPIKDVAGRLGLIDAGNDAMLKKFCSCKGSEDA